MNRLEPFHHKHTLRRGALKKRAYATSVGALCLATGVALWGVSPQALAGPSPCSLVRTYTLNGDFDEGVFNNVNHDVPHQLQLSETPEPFPFIWIAASGRGTILKLDSATGDILGEYRSAPDTVGFPNPSRTTVDQLGNCWVANREDVMFCDGADKGSITRVGQIIGGTPVTGDGFLDPDGQYLAPPYTYNTCEDRDNDGLIRTSNGLGDVLPWGNAAGEDTCGGVATAEDECIINCTRVAGTATRAVAVDANNDVWVGGTGNRIHEKLDGVTGQPIPGTAFSADCGGYGGLIDGNGVLWSATYPTAPYLMRADTADIAGTLQCIPIGRTSYGLGLDQLGNVWNSNWDSNSVMKFAPDGSILGTFSTGGASNDRGVAVSPVDNHVWIANSGGSNVSRLDNDGNLVKVVELGPDGVQPTGVAVDADGKVWATCYSSDTAKRIDPNGGADGLGEVDLTVDLGSGATPYNYSDMTGILAFPGGFGSWTVVHDSCADGIEWGVATWNTELCAIPHEPPGTGLTVEVRAADSAAGLASEPWFTVENGVPFTGLFGRYVEVRVGFEGVQDPFTTPVLCDLTISPLGAIGRAHPGCNWVDNVIELTGNEPTYWSAATGQPKGVSPFPALDPGDPPGRPDPEGSWERVLRGFVVAWAVNADGEQIRWNHLKGDAVVVNYRTGSAWEYGAHAFQAHGPDHGDPVGGPGALNLDGAEYDSGFNQLLLDFYAVGSMGLSGNQWKVDVDTDLTLLPLDIDLRQDREGPTITKAKFDIWNMNEWKFSGTERCITCWDQALLGNYDPPNHFLLKNLGTDKGKARIDGVASTVCPDSIETPLLAVAMKWLMFDGDVAFAQAGMNLVGMGSQPGVILFDPSDGPPPTKMLSSSKPLGRQTETGIVERPYGGAAAVDCLARVSDIQKGSLIIFPKVELRWDVTGRLIQDTFLDLTNDYPADVLVQMYFVNGDPPLPAAGP